LRFRLNALDRRGTHIFHSDGGERGGRPPVFGCWVCVFVFKIKQGTRFTSECLKDILRDKSLSLSLSPSLSPSLCYFLVSGWFGGRDVWPFWKCLVVQLWLSNGKHSPLSKYNGALLYVFERVSSRRSVDKANSTDTFLLLGERIGVSLKNASTCQISHINLITCLNFLFFFW
jgi:hypothetical protein